jgi:TonB-dependent SusC/RagA subfamily outer membrane receptor
MTNKTNQKNMKKIKFITIFLLFVGINNIQAQNSEAPIKTSHVVTSDTLNKSRLNPTPLYVIDGSPSSESAMTLLNSEDIESVSVLKDAALIAPYGVAGAGGVILIATKKNKNKKN